MAKAIVGTFYSEPEAIYAIDGLKRQGYDATDIMVMSKTRRNLPMVTAETGAKVEAGMSASTVTDVMMDSFLAMMTGGMMGSHTNTLANKLVNMGVPNVTAKQCESEMDQGKILVMIDTDAASTSPVYSSGSGTQYEAEEQRALRLHEERIDITKQRVTIGEVQVRKEVVQEQRTIHVPVTREEVYVERRPVIDGNFDGNPITTESEVIRVPIIEERIEVSKKPVVVEEVIIGKRIVQETKQVQDIIKKEEAHIQRSSAPVLVEEVSKVALIDTKPEEVHLARTSLPAVGKDKSIAILADNKKHETYAEHSELPTVEANKSMNVSADNKKPEAHAKLSESRTVEEDKNAASANKKKK